MIPGLCKDIFDWSDNNINYMSHWWEIIRSINDCTFFCEMWFLTVDFLIKINKNVPMIGVKNNWFSQFARSDMIDQTMI